MRVMVKDLVTCERCGLIANWLDEDWARRVRRETSAMTGALRGRNTHRAA
jgi:hypothetical protein